MRSRLNNARTTDRRPKQSRSLRRLRRGEELGQLSSAHAFPDLSDLRSVPSLVIANEDEPLVEVQRPEDAMRVRQLADGQSVGGRDDLAQLQARFLETAPGALGVDAGHRTHGIRTTKLPRPIEDVEGERVLEDRARFRLRAQSGRTRIVDAFAEERCDAAFDHGEVLEHVDDGPLAVRLNLVTIDGDRVDRVPNFGTPAVEMVEQLLDAWMHMTKPLSNARHPVPGRRKAREHFGVVAGNDESRVGGER